MEFFGAFFGAFGGGVAGLYLISWVWFLLLPILVVFWLSVPIARAIVRRFKTELPGDMPAVVLLVMFALVIVVGLSADLALDHFRTAGTVARAAIAG
jgi:hypothetical protein